MGGRLKFDGSGSSHKSGCHKFEVPVHAAKATAGFGLRREANDSRFQYRKISLLHHVKEKGYHLNDSVMERIEYVNADNSDKVSGKSGKRRSCQHRHQSQDPFSSSFSHRLCQLQTAVLPEFTGPFPIAKVNFFEIYIACVRIV